MSDRSAAAPPSAASAPPHPLRLGFLGTGWIGRLRMRALLDGGVATAAVIAEPEDAARADAGALAPHAARVRTLEELLEHADDLDGVVIATPSALHAEQSIAALERGLAVFSQKPLARDAAEAQRVLDAAAALDRPFGVDLSYRHTAAVRRMEQELAAGTIGEPITVELVFDNAYGPDKPWFLDRRRSGGGALIDLGTHLLDLALALTGATELTVGDVELRRGGRPLAVLEDPTEVEDLAWVGARTDTGVAVRVACSWFGPAGADCRIGVTVVGTRGALALGNVDGSFYDLALERREGTRTERLIEPPDDWGGRAALTWAAAVAAGERFDPREAARALAVHTTLDRIYARGGRCAS